jgi:uncharacterized membrane protein
MSDIFLVISLWLHSLSTAILIGNFFLLSLIYVPALSSGGGAFLAEASKRSRPWLYAALILFAISGAYLTFTDSNYLGLANFGNPWGIVMLIKHTVVFVMLVIGFYFNAMLRVGPNSAAGKPENIARMRQYANLMSLCGAVVLLLTAVGQVL